MIVSTMSKEEVIKEMLSDFDVVRRKSEYSIKELRRQLLKTKKYPLIQSYDYLTPKTKNTWVYILDLKSKNDIFQTFVNYHYTSIGFMAALVSTDMSITFYTGHFFTRFVEREKLGISQPGEMIKKYFILNPFCQFEAQGKLNDGAKEVMGLVHSGVVLGVKTKNNIIVCNTYLSKDMLRKDQTLIANSLKAELDNYMAMEKAGLI